MASAFVYARGSTDCPAAEQEAQARAHFGQVLEEFTWAGVYSDPPEMRNRRLACRPAGSRLCLELQPGDVVIIASAAAAWQNSPDMMSNLGGWLRRGIAAHLLDLDLRTDAPDGGKLLELLGRVVAAEGARRSEGASARRAALRAAGRPQGGAVPLGQRVVGEKGRRRFAKDDWYLECARKFHELQTQGFSLVQIWRWTLEHRVRRTDGSEWARTAIHEAIHYAQQSEAQAAAAAP